MEITNDSFCGLEFLSVFFLLLEHLLFIFGSFTFEQFFSLVDHVVNIFGFFIHSPSVVNLTGFELVLIIIHQSIYLTILFYFYSHFFYFCYHLAFKIIFKFTGLLNILGCAFDFLLNFSELF